MIVKRLNNALLTGTSEYTIRSTEGIKIPGSIMDLRGFEKESDILLCIIAPNSEVIFSMCVVADLSNMYMDNLVLWVQEECQTIAEFGLQKHKFNSGTMESLRLCKNIFCNYYCETEEEVVNRINELKDKKQGESK